MAQSDQTIQNASFPNVRADINDNLEALFTQSSGASEPTTKVAFQPWVDTSTSPPTWKIRNAANSGWITVGVLDPANFGVGGVTPIANGGTGQTTVAAAIAALLPSQTGNADKALVTNGTSLLWSVITSSSFTKYTFAAGTGTGSTRTHTWTKPGSGSTAVVLIWGGGGAGGADNNVGGGGGAGSNCGFGLFPLADLGATETITIGQGGQGGASDGNGANGTNSTFGSHVTSYGGRGGDDDDGQVAFGSTPFGRGDLESSLGLGIFPFDLFSGGYGGEQQGDNSSGGNAVFGGAGGGNAGINNSADPPGGTSIIAGNGGAGNRAQGDAVDGSTPGGGGGGAQEGTAGSGGDGECWVLIF
jgi:hypothetical protein